MVQRADEKPGQDRDHGKTHIQGRFGDAELVGVGAGHIAEILAEVHCMESVWVIGLQILDGC